MSLDPNVGISSVQCHVEGLLRQVMQTKQMLAVRADLGVPRTQVERTNEEIRIAEGVKEKMREYFPEIDLFLDLERMVNEVRGMLPQAAPSVGEPTVTTSASEEEIFSLQSLVSDLFPKGQG